VGKARREEDRWRGGAVYRTFAQKEKFRTKLNRDGGGGPAWGGPVGGGAAVGNGEAPSTAGLERAGKRRKKTWPPREKFRSAGGKREIVLEGNVSLEEEPLGVDAGV